MPPDTAGSPGQDRITNSAACEHPRTYVDTDDAVAVVICLDCGETVAVPDA